jgi:acylaminoacyl-peptidase
MFDALRSSRGRLRAADGRDARSAASSPFGFAVLLLGLVVAASTPGTLAAQAGEAGPGISTDRFESLDVFELEWAGDPQISPDGERIVYVRGDFGMEDDGSRADLWIVNADGTGHRPLTDGGGRESSPRWSPEGDRLVYVSTREEGAEIWLRWMDTGQEARLTSLTESPSDLSWSPDGERIAFTTFVPGEDASLASMPPKPEGADWGPPFEVIDELRYRADGAGYLESGHRHLFVLPAEGGTPRQVTSGPWDHGGTPVWSPDGEHLIFSANRHEDAEHDPLNSEIYEVALTDGSVRALTDRQGPDGSPALSPDGSQIAYTGFDDRHQGYQVTRLYVMDRDGTGSRVVTEELDRSVQDPAWRGDGEGLYVQYDDEGDTKLAFVGLDGSVEELTGDVGGLSLGRPYSGGTYSVTPDGRFAFTHTAPDHPADVATGRHGDEEVRRLTRLNADLFSHKELGRVEEIWYESSHDGRRIQGWIVTPPGFDPSREYPMILEIHGGPFANYGDRFSAEVQLYASAGYVVLYTNPRGSTSYGGEFGNLIHHAYPGRDYDDLMSGVDAVLERGFVDEERLFVTGGSGGGVLTAWIVGRTDRFRAAVSAKPVINWYSFVLTADNPVFFSRYWFPGPPWEHEEHYMDRSPLSLVGEVSTPTMLMTGELDYRTPISETEQYYTGLKLRDVPAAMVRIPDASHGIASKPSNLVGKVEHILAWFERYRTEP